MSDTPLCKQTAQLVLAIALRYQLLQPNQGELLADRKADSIEAACQRLLEDGYLTTREFRFLLGRAEEVAAADGRGVCGTHPDSGALSLAIDLAFLTHEQMQAFLDEQEMSSHLEPGQTEQEQAYLPLLYNLGYLKLYQVIDLLEKLSILIDHCDACRTQTMAFHREAGICKACGVRMQRLTGWSSDEELLRPIPRIRMLLIRRGRAPKQEAQTSDQPVVEALPSPEVQVPGTSQTFLMIEDEAFPIDEEKLAEQRAEPPRITDGQVVRVIRRYHMLEESRAEELEKVRSGIDKPLLRVLGEFGFIRSLGIAFIRRQLGACKNGPSDLGPLALAIDRGYLSPGVMPHGSESISGSEELSLLAQTYNNQVLQFYQLIDLLTSTGTFLAHCEACKIQLHVADGQLTHCPGCDSGGSLLMLHHPPEDVGVVLPRIQHLRVQMIEEETQTASPKQADEPRKATGQYKAGEGTQRVAPLPPPEKAEQALDPDQLIIKLIVRYGLLTPGVLRKTISQLPAAAEETPLETRLFQDGRLTAMELSFLAQKKIQAVEGLMGELFDQSLTDIALSKDYLNQRRLLKLSRMPGAPDLSAANDLEVATFLHRRGALTFYQVVDLLEEIGIYLIACTDCKVQYQLVGEVDPSQFQICPGCDGVMLALTTPPGWPLLLHRLPAIDNLNIQRMNAAAFDKMNASSMQIKALEGPEQSSAIVAQSASLIDRRIASGIEPSVQGAVIEAEAIASSVVRAIAEPTPEPAMLEVVEETPATPPAPTPEPLAAIAVAPEPQPAVAPEPVTAKAEVEITPEPAPEPMSEPKPEPTSEPKPEPMSEPKPAPTFDVPTDKLPIAPAPTNLKQAAELMALGESSAEIETAPALVELNLGASAPAAQPAARPTAAQAPKPAPARRTQALEQRRQTRRKQVASARNVIQNFYQESFPERDLKARAPAPTRRMMQPSSTRLASPVDQIVQRDDAPAASPRQAARAQTTGQIVEQGVHQIKIALGVLITLLLLAVGWGIWSAWKPRETLQDKLGTQAQTQPGNGPDRDDTVSVSGEVSQLGSGDTPPTMLIAVDLDRDMRIVCESPETQAQLRKVAAKFREGEAKGLRIFIKVTGLYRPQQAGEVESVQARQILRIFRLPRERVVVEKRR